MFRSGGRGSLDGVAARGLVSGRGPRRSRGRDEVGTCSDKPSQTSPIATGVVSIYTARMDILRRSARRIRLS